MANRISIRFWGFEFNGEGWGVVAASALAIAVIAFSIAVAGTPR